MSTYFSSEFIETPSVASTQPKLRSNKPDEPPSSALKLPAQVDNSQKNPTESLKRLPSKKFREQDPADVFCSNERLTRHSLERKKSL